MSGKSRDIFSELEKDLADEIKTVEDMKGRRRSRGRFIDAVERIRDPHTGGVVEGHADSPWPKTHEAIVPAWPEALEGEALKKTRDATEKLTVSREEMGKRLCDAINVVTKRDGHMTFSLSAPIKAPAWIRKIQDFRTIPLNGFETFVLMGCRTGARNQRIWQFKPETEADTFGDGFDYVEFDENKAKQVFDNFAPYLIDLHEVASKLVVNKDAFKITVDEDDYRDVEGFGSW